MLSPGATIGILGGGQLGRMLAIAARRLGYRPLALDPDPACPAAGLVDRLVVGGYDDERAAIELADASDVVTYELEHVDAEVVTAVADRCPVRPGLAALRAGQDRLAERAFLERLDAPVAPWHAVRSLDDLMAGVSRLGLPCRLKAAIGGYDGRSQRRLGEGADRSALEQAFEDLGGRGRPLLLERELAFACELSVVCARGEDGTTLPFPVARNRHDEGILVESLAPAPVPDEVAARARDLAARIMADLDAIGVLTAELFLMPDGSLAVNELAPRVHNSGHWTLDGAVTDQFEQHIRAICGLPLGSVEPTAPAVAMVNLLGAGARRSAALRGAETALADSAVRLHLYDKRLVFERRKMGHLTVAAASAEAALARALAARDALTWAD